MGCPAIVEAMVENRGPTPGVAPGVPARPTVACAGVPRPLSGRAGDARICGYLG